MAIPARSARLARLHEPWDRARHRRLKVAELFCSLQGEGSRTGLPTVFLRLTGCALRCSWCDTAWAFHEGEWADLELIERRILDCGVPRLCVTGGEPLLQPTVVPLIRRFVAAHGFDVSVETGGDQDISVLPEEVVRILDVKLPASGMALRFDRANLERLTPNDEVKFVIASREDYEAARSWIEGPLAGFRGEILLSPVHSCLEPERLAAWILADRLPARFQLQLHKVLWPQEIKGV